MSPSRIKLKQPNRSAPTEETLLQFAQERGLFEQAQQKQQQQSSKKQPSEAAKAAQDDDSGISPAAERIMDTLLWMVSLSMLHFTLDVLVQNQYAVEISWGRVAQRAGQALLGIVQVPVSVANPKTIDKLTRPVPSLQHALLRTTPPSLKTERRTRPRFALPSSPSAGSLLHDGHVRRLLSYTHHQQLWVLSDHEASSTTGLHMGVVCHRT
jgi:hypothetical protein